MSDCNSYPTLKKGDLIIFSPYKKVYHAGKKYVYSHTVENKLWVYPLTSDSVDYLKDENLLPVDMISLDAPVIIKEGDGKIIPISPDGLRGIEASYYSQIVSLL
jgi:hypothetical protein